MLVCSDDDPGIYDNPGRTIIIILFVDDGSIIGKNRNEMVSILKKLNEEFEITYDTGSGNKLIWVWKLKGNLMKFT